MHKRPRLAILTSHPIQYYGPLFRELARRIDLKVFFAHRATPTDQSRAGFSTGFDWDIDITSGYEHEFLHNVSSVPGTDRFLGCDTPAIAAKLKFGKFDALLVTGWNLKSYAQGVIAAKRQGIPVLIRGDSQLGSARSAAKRAAKAVTYPPFLRLFDAALYVGEKSRDYYRHYGYPEHRLFHSPHCVDTDRFSFGATVESRAEMRAELSLSENNFAILFAGKLIDLKRPMTLIHALSVCRQVEPKVDVVAMIAGDGDLRGDTAILAAELQVPTHFLGFCNQSRMPTVFAASDLLVLPSLHETWGLVVNEALASGRPVVVSDACGCAPEVLRTGAGRTFPVGDIQALASAIRSVITNPPAHSAMETFTKQHSLHAAATGIEAALAALKAGS